MTKEALAQTSEEETPVFPLMGNENDNSSDSPSEETDTEQTPSSEENKEQTEEDEDASGKNLNDLPRWKEREEDWKKRFNDQETRHLDEITKLREEFESKFTSHNSEDETNEQVPEWFGGDLPQWKQYQRDLDNRLNKAKEEARTEALKEIDSKSANEQKKIDEATAFFQQEVESLENDKNLNPEGQKVDRNKLLKFVLDNQLVDTQGRWNYKAGFKLMRSETKSSKTANLKDKKELASATISDDRAESKKRTFTTSEDFSKPGSRPW